MAIGLGALSSCTHPGLRDTTRSAIRIHHIQGAAHVSPLNGRAVSRVPGIVTGMRPHGFYMEDWLPDADPATSEAIYVYTADAPAVNVGDQVLVSGTVGEFRPGGSGGLDNLSLTQIGGPIIESGSDPSAALPAPVVIGIGGRHAPSRVIAGAAPDANVENGGRFDPARHGIDFYESLESMRVVMNAAVAVGPSGAFNDTPVVADNGLHAAPRSARGGVVVSASDFNPERLMLAGPLLNGGRLSRLNVGDILQRVEGIVDYGFGHFKLMLTSAPAVKRARLRRETTPLQGSADRLTVASYNVANLDASDAPSKFDKLAVQIVRHLMSPDIVALLEVQDDNGAADDGMVASTATLSQLHEAIRKAGGPAYAHRQIDPQDDQDGGEPGGNIRQVLLFNPDRVAFVDRPGGRASGAVSVLRSAAGARLTASPGRIAPLDRAFTASRKPLAAEFSFNGHTVFVLANHFVSKRGDQPLFGRHQPPATTSERQRVAQAEVVSRFVSSLLSADTHAKVIVLGDFNDFEFSRTLAVLKSAPLVNLVDSLPQDQRYTYIHEGNSQVLDHALVSPALATRAAPELDIVHLNAEFAEHASDHDPLLVRLTLPRAPR